MFYSPAWWSLVNVCTYYLAKESIPHCVPLSFLCNPVLSDIQPCIFQSFPCSQTLTSVSQLIVTSGWYLGSLSLFCSLEIASRLLSGAIKRLGSIVFSQGSQSCAVIQYLKALLSYIFFPVLQQFIVEGHCST